MQLYGPLDNYISKHRRVEGLSQEELAVLVGVEEGGSIGRYEQGLRRPDLYGLLALELVLDEPMQALFAGVSMKVRQEVASRARALLEAMTDKVSDQNAQKLSTLSRLAHVDEEQLDAWEGNP